jgi:hypothetical protein
MAESGTATPVFIRGALALLLTTVPSAVLAHGEGCAGPEWQLDVYVMLGLACLAWMAVALVFGLWSIGGRPWWEITSRLLLVGLAFVLLCLAAYLNIGTLLGCTGRELPLMAANVACAAGLQLRRLGRTRFASGSDRAP